MGHHLHVDASRVVAVDGDAIPTGEFIDVTDTVFDFRTPERIDYRWNETVGLCGGGKSPMIFDSMFIQTNHSQDVAGMTTAGSTTITRRRRPASLYGARSPVFGR